MRHFGTRLAGVVICISSIFGLVLSIYGLYAIWSAHPKVVSQVQDLIQLANHSMDASDGMLKVLSSSLDKASQDLTLMHTILKDTASTIGQSTTTVDDTANLLGKDLPSVVKNAQDSLTATQNTAQFIDNTLQALASIPFIGPSLTSGYSPKVPLGQAVDEVNRSLDPLSGSFSKLHQDLQVASASMATIQGEVASLSGQVEDVQISVADAKKEVMNYQLILSELRDQFDTLTERLPTMINLTFIGITVVLSWILLSQIGTLLLAFELISRRVRPDQANEK